MSDGKKNMDSIQKQIEAVGGPLASSKAALEKATGVKALTAQSDRLADLTTQQVLDDALIRTVEPTWLRNTAFGDSVNAVHALQAEGAARLALDPIQDMRGLIHNDRIQTIMGRHQGFMTIGERLEAQFRMPAIGEVARLATQIHESMHVATRPLIAQSAAITSAMESMRTPWISAVDALRSAQSFGSLQNIGATLMQQTAFGDAATASLRDYLGDWREQISFSDEMVSSISARSRLYESLGFDTGLTDFPNPAFEAALTSAGLWEEVPEIEVVPSLYLPAPRESDEQGFLRTNRAHDRLQRFEAHIRRFIESKMRKAFGGNWIVHRVPHDFRKKWRAKQEKAQEHGAEVFPLIEYADFTDYEIIIVRDDNWKEIFKSIFRRKESIHESLRRLYPIRHTTMHSRPISQSDEIYLVAEIMRILKAIGVQ